MISSLDSTSNAFLNGLDQIQRRSERAQRELTTGLRLNTVSDDPSLVSALLDIHGQLDRNQQTTENLNRVKAEVDTAENSLQTAVKLVDRAQTLGAQGNTALSTPEARLQMATELGGVLEQLVALSNTNVAGRYLFSGDSDQSAAYGLDLTQPNPTGTYAGSQASRQIEMPDGSLVSLAKTAAEMFDSPTAGQNVFRSVNDLRTALLNNDLPAIAAASKNLSTAGAYLNQQLSFYGMAQNRVSDGLDSANTRATQLQARLSAIQDADPTRSIEELTKAATQQQAALASRAKLPRTSLFDFLG